MGQQVIDLEQTVMDLAESGSEFSPKGTVGDPDIPPEPSGNPMAPDKVTTGGGQLLFKANNFLGSSDASGTLVRVKLVSSGVYEDVTSTWYLDETKDPGNMYGTGENRVTTGLLGQTPPGSSTAANYSLDKFNEHGKGWERDGGGKLKSTVGVQIEGIAGYIETVLVTKLNELIAQYNQLRVDYNNGVVPTTATEVTQLTI